VAPHEDRRFAFMGGTTVVQQSLYLASWGVNLTVVLYNGHRYFIIKQVCSLLGVGYDNQLDALRERELLEDMVMKLPINTSKGIRDAWCIKLEAIAAWMLIISDRRVRSESRPNLLKLQRDLMVAARRAMFGEVDAASVQQEVQDLRHFAWFLESQIVAMQRGQPRLLLPEGDDEGEG